MTNQIFVSYRRKDSQLVCDRLYGSLTEVFGTGQVFRDISTIAGGFDFRLAIEQAMQTAKVVLVLIGPQWLPVTDGQGHRRLDDPNDRVRQEIELALRKNLIIIPVLVQQATMPRESELPPSLGPLAFRNARVVRPDPDYARDVQAVIRDVAEYLPPPARSRSMRPIRSTLGRSRRLVGSALSLLTLLLTVLSLATWINIPLLSDFVRRLLGH
jgi:TIR domain